MASLGWTVSSLLQESSCPLQGVDLFLQLSWVSLRRPIFHPFRSRWESGWDAIELSISAKNLASVYREHLSLIKIWMGFGPNPEIPKLLDLHYTSEHFIIHLTPEKAFHAKYVDTKQKTNIATEILSIPNQ